MLRLGMFKPIILICLFLSFNILADSRKKVVVLDTGIYRHMAKKPYMCKNMQFFTNNKGIYDENGHGSNVVGIISESINVKTHCIVSINLYNKDKDGGNMEDVLKAYRLALSLKNVKIVNLSIGGRLVSKTEGRYIERFLNRGIKVVAAAGNSGKSLDEEIDFYPASFRKKNKHKNFYVVGSRYKFSNYGSFVTDYFPGKNVRPNIPGVRSMTGTSQSTAQKTASLLKNMVISN